MSESTSNNKTPSIYKSLGEIPKLYKAHQHIYSTIAKFFKICPRTYGGIENSVTNIQEHINNLHTLTDLRPYLDELNKSTKAIRDLLKSYTTLLTWLQKPSELTADSIKTLVQDMQSYMKDIQKHPLTKFLFDASSVWAGTSKILKLLEQATSQKTEDPLQPNIYLTMAGYTTCIMLPVLIHFVTSPEKAVMQKSTLEYLEEAAKDSKNPAILTKDPILNAIISALQQYIGKDMPSLFNYWDFITKQTSTVSSVANIIPKIAALLQNPVTKAIPKIAFNFLASTVPTVTDNTAEVTWGEPEPLRATTQVTPEELTKLIYGKMPTRNAFNYSEEYKQDLTNNNLGLILMEAVKQQDKELIAILLADPYHADINIQDTDNKTPLMIAIENKDEELVALLLTCKDIELGRATLTAIDTNNTNILQMILDCPFWDSETIYELPNGKDVTIMEYATLRNNQEAIKIFQDLGFELELLSEKQSVLNAEHSPLPVSIPQPSTEQVHEPGNLERLLQPYEEMEQVLPTESIEPATDKTNSPTTKTLPQISTKTSPNNNQSMLIRHINMIRNETKLKAIEGLLKLPDFQDLQKTDIHGNTALHVAITNPNIPPTLKIQLISLLLKNGADIHQKNKAGKSSYDIARDTKNNSLLKLLTNKPTESPLPITTPRRSR